MTRLSFCNLILLLWLIVFSSVGYADTAEPYGTDEDFAVHVADEATLNYRTAFDWLLSPNDDSSIFGARSSWRGNIAINYRYFCHEGLYPDQPHSDTSLIIEPEYSLTWPDGHVLVFAPYLQLDDQDHERSHFDLREFYFMWVSDTFELSCGFKKIFWGVTESQNLVDIINQSDFIARGDSSDKLGQPMVNLTLLQDWGTVDLFVMPYFREQIFAGKHGRLRPSIPIDADRAEYEDSDKEKHIDYAIRYSHYLGELEFGLSYFNGTAREPEIIGADYVMLPQGPVPTALIPYYFQVEQTGLDLQYILDSWLLKAEIVNRNTEKDNYNAWTVGFEYTFTGILNTETDLSILGEWLYDSRNDDSTSPYNNDIMAGTRLAFNDTNNSEITVNVIKDLDYSATVLNIEATRRLTDHLSVDFDLYWCWEDEPHDVFYPLRNDDLISCKLAYYF